MHNKITYIASFYYEVSSPQASLLEYVQYMQLGPGISSLLEAEKKYSR